MGQLVAQCRKLNDALRKCDINAEVGCKKTFFSYKAFITYPDGTVNQYTNRSETRLSLYLIEEVQHLIRQKRDENQAETDRKMHDLYVKVQQALCNQDREKLDERSQQCLIA